MRTDHRVAGRIVAHKVRWEASRGKFDRAEWKTTNICIYIYIYMYREREREIISLSLSLYIYIYRHGGLGASELAGCVSRSRDAAAPGFRDPRFHMLRYVCMYACMYVGR